MITAERVRSAAVALGLCLGGASLAHAGSLSVAPLRVMFTPERGISAITLTNTGPDTLTVEAEVRPWPADAPEQAAKDITVNPPISTLAPGEKVTVRVGLVRRLPRGFERSYRLYFTELPQPRLEDAQGVGVRLRVGIPLFVAAERAAPAPLEWSAAPEGDALLLTALNRGNVHQRVLGLVATRGSARIQATHSSPYVLPGRSAEFRLSGLTVTTGERVSLQVETDTESKQVDVLVP